MEDRPKFNKSNREHPKEEKDQSSVHYNDGALSKGNNEWVLTAQNSRINRWEDSFQNAWKISA